MEGLNAVQEDALYVPVRELIRGLSYVYGGVDPFSGKHPPPEPMQTGFSGALLLPPLGLSLAMEFLAEEKQKPLYRVLARLFKSAQFLLIKDVEGAQLTLNAERVGQNEALGYQYPVTANPGGTVSVGFVDHLTWLFSPGTERTKSLELPYDVKKELESVSAGGLGGVAVPVMHTVLNLWLDFFYPVTDEMYSHLHELRDFALRRLGKDFYAKLVERPAALTQGNLFVFEFHPDYVPKVTKATLYTGVFPLSKPYASVRLEGGLEHVSVTFAFGAAFENEDSVVAAADLLLKNVWLGQSSGADAKEAGAKTEPKPPPLPGLF